MIHDCIFIVGCGHSGTSLLNKIIGNHKNVHGIPEESSVFFHDSEKIRLVLQSWSQERAKNCKKWICEKTPRHVHYLDKIYCHIHDPKIIVITRDGRDVVSSLMRRAGFQDFNVAVERWINDNQAWMTHPYRDRFHVVRYEALVEMPHVELVKICTFLGEEMDDNMLNYSRHQNCLRPTINPNTVMNYDDHVRLRAYQINQALYDGRGRWQADLSLAHQELLRTNEKFMRVMEEIASLEKIKNTPLS